MTTEDLRGINVKGGQVDIHGNTFVFQEKTASLILDQQPPNVDTFQGRDAELRQIQDWVQEAAVRLIGMTASGGYGKTFLVAKALTQAEGLSLPPLWVSFNQPYAFATFGRWLLQQFGQAVDEKLPDEALLLAVVEQLSQQRGLLVMDNLETLLNDEGQWQEPLYGAFFRRWLSHGRQSTLLLTSRERFSLPDNQQGMSRWYDLEGLTTDAGMALLTAKGIRGAEADLERFVALVDGHPLSLSLTAGWLLNPKKNVAPDVTYALKQDDLYRFEQMVGDHRGDPDASVGRILAASVARLTPTLKTLWQNLSVYRLAFNLAAAQAMMATATLDDLWELARRSLLQEQPVAAAVQTLEAKWQFKFLPLVQRFAQQQAGALAEAHTQAVAYYRSVEHPEPWQALEDVTAYLEAFHHLCDLGQYTQAKGEIIPCNNFLDLQGYNSVRLELSMGDWCRHGSKQPGTLRRMTMHRHCWEPSSLWAMPTAPWHSTLQPLQPTNRFWILPSRFTTNITKEPPSAVWALPTSIKAIMARRPITCSNGSPSRVRLATVRRKEPPSAIWDLPTSIKAIMARRPITCSNN